MKVGLPPNLVSPETPRPSAGTSFTSGSSCIGRTPVPKGGGGRVSGRELRPRAALDRPLPEPFRLDRLDPLPRVIGSTVVPLLVPIQAREIPVPHRLDVLARHRAIGQPHFERCLPVDAEF